MSSELARRVDEAKSPGIALELRQARPQIEAALPSAFPGGAERFVRLVLTAVRLAPDLAKCTPISIMGAAMQCAQLGLSPGALGEAWLIPYKRGNVYEATFQIGWRGWVALAARSGMVVTGATVRERDAFDYSLGLEPTLSHKPAHGDRGPSVCWYAIVRDRDTGRLLSFAVVDREHVEKRRRYGRSGDSPAWRNWYDEMALGKAVREAFRTMALSVELGVALSSEETVRSNLEASAEELGEVWQPGEPEPEAAPPEAESGS